MIEVEALVGWMERLRQPLARDGLREVTWVRGGSSSTRPQPRKSMNIPRLIEAHMSVLRLSLRRRYFG